jgi:hypothetical protein
MIALSSAAHRLPHAHPLARLAEHPGGVLAALIGVQDDARHLAAAQRHCHRHRGVGRLRVASREAVRARRIGAGVPYSAVERELVDADKLRLLLALAMFGDAKRGGEVVPKLRRRCGQAAVKAFDAAKEGTHTRYEGRSPPSRRGNRSLGGATPRMSPQDLLAEADRLLATTVPGTVVGN